MRAIKCSLVVAAIAALPTVASAAETTMVTPPSGYDANRSGIQHGMVMSTTYPTKSYGTKNMRVYLPPGYSTAKKYPVVYLHHGIGGDETSWTNGASAHYILDNLIADGLAVPMILVMPNNSMTTSCQPRGSAARRQPPRSQLIATATAKPAKMPYMRASSTMACSGGPREWLGRWAQIPLRMAASRPSSLPGIRRKRTMRATGRMKPRAALSELARVMDMRTGHAQ